MVPVTSREEIADVARRYLKGWETRDPAVFDALLAPDFVDHMYGQPRNRDQLLADAADTSYERQMSIDDVMVDGDRVAARVRSHLRHRETGREATVTGMVMLRMVDGVIVEGWGEHDRLGQLQQWDIIPSGPALRDWMRERLSE
jgi:ketosteroid isomerase-like protein